MKWIIGIGLLALVGLYLAFKKWMSSADEFWGTVQERADERDQETAARKAAERAERQRKAIERAEAAKAKAAAEAGGEAEPTPEAAEARPEPAAEPEAPATFADVGPGEAVKLIAHRHDLVILDVRTPGETMAGILENALLIPMDQLQGRLGELPDGPILIYCAVGARSAAVAEFLVRTGRDEVFNLDGGIMAWTGKVVRPA